MKPISLIALSAALLCSSSAYSDCQKTILLIGQSNAVRMAKYGDVHEQAKAIFPDCKIIFRGSLRSGTPIADFMPTYSGKFASLYAGTTSQLTTIDAIIYWQGENDSIKLSTTKTWAANFKALIGLYRNGYGVTPTIPVVMFAINAHNTKYHWQTMRRIQMSTFMPNLHVIDTTDRYQFREDNTHLVTEAYRNAVHDALTLTQLVMAAPVVSQNAVGGAQ